MDYAKKSNDARVNNDLDEKNLKFYLDKEKEIIGQRQQQQQVISTQQQQQQNAVTAQAALTRKQFVDEKSLEITKDHPNLTPKQVFTRANMLWKNKNK
jgi:hypothetical protein